MSAREDIKARLAKAPKSQRPALQRELRLATQDELRASIAGRPIEAEPPAAARLIAAHAPFLAAAAQPAPYRAMADLQ